MCLHCAFIFEKHFCWVWDSGMTCFIFFQNFEDAILSSIISNGKSELLISFSLILSKDFKLFIFIFQVSENDEPRCDSLCISLFEMHWAFWICLLIFFSYFCKFKSANIIFSSQLPTHHLELMDAWYYTFKDRFVLVLPLVLG